MYQYNKIDQTLIEERVAQFRDQTQRFFAGEISEEQFRPLRLMNGIYLQTHAPMLRIAIPYGNLASRQLRMLAHIARTYDKGYAHITTRQNVQFNWPELERTPDILADLATVQMHAIQTSGNCLRNTTSDPLAGICADEVEDPRPYCEIIRQWSTLHPEFAYLPRKFKIAVSGGSAIDRAATQLHDIGLYLTQNDEGETGFEVLVGGGLGRTPIIGKTIRPFLQKQHLISYLEAILRVYNLHGRRDNKYKARIKILVKESGIDIFRQQVEAEWQHIQSQLLLSDTDINTIKAHFTPPAYEADASNFDLNQYANNADFQTWLQHNTGAHKIPGYRYVYLSLKPTGVAPGDITDKQLDAVADIADQYSFGEVRTTHRQNLILADVKQAELMPLWEKLKALNLAAANIGTLNDLICCPGLDFCGLANAASISIAQEIQEAFDKLDYLHDLGDIKINISGCMNGCAHQSVGHIGILGVDKKGVEWYQITLGGSSDTDAAIGERLGPAVEKGQVVKAIEIIIQTYTEARLEEESFLDTFKRVGIDPFKERVYANH